MLNDLRQIQSPEGLAAERQQKEERVKGYLQERGLKAVVLSRINNFAWLTAGGNNRIVASEATGAASLVYTAAGEKFVVTNVSEAKRLQEEELPDWQVVSCRWDEDQAALLQRVLGGRAAVADTPDWGLPLATDFNPLRYQLLPTESERLRWLSQRTGLAVAEACRQHQPGESEHQAAARLQAALAPAGITAPVVLVASDERIFQYRHPVPTTKPVERYLMVVVVAEKWGLHASATRLVSFGPLEAELTRKFEALATVDHTYLQATRPGAAVADVFRQGLEAYRTTGFADEWQLHHQGGATGYSPRDYLGTASSQERVLENQAFAWNPTITGTKMEDTILVTAGGNEILTAVEGWPLVNGRPGPLVR